jgi:hypothetical protein
MSVDIYKDVWTISNKMRSDIREFFVNMTDYKIAEIGSYKGFTTRELASIFSMVYAVDNNSRFTLFNKKLNRGLKNIKYVMLDIYNHDWTGLPEDIEVVFIDACHTYECCKSDIQNSLTRFINLKYIIFDDYGVWPGVKQAVDEFIGNDKLELVKYIGLTNVPGPNRVIVNNVNEGVICKVKN